MPIIALSEECIWVILFIINLILAWIIGDTMEYKEALFYWRKKKNISKYRLSALTGISESHLRNLENGIKQPNYSTIVSIADALELSLSEFFNIDSSDRIYLSENDKRLLEVFRRMPKDKGELFIEYIGKALELEEEVKS